MDTTRSPYDHHHQLGIMCGVNWWILPCYSNKMKSVSWGKMSTWSSTCRQSDIRVTNISKSSTYKLAAETSWHREGTKLRHCHSICIAITLGRIGITGIISQLVDVTAQRRALYMSFDRGRTVLSLEAYNRGKRGILRWKRSASASVTSTVLFNSSLLDRGRHALSTLWAYCSDSDPLEPV